MNFKSVAIDGPSGAGKSTISRKVAEDLGFIYVDTGAMYRVIGLFSLTNELDLTKIDIGMKYIDGVQHMYLNGTDVTEDIRRHEVSKAASDVSARPEVRAFLLESQRKLARENNVIMDGRDIGTVVLPNADCKIFLTASVEDRAQRRFLELRSKGSEVTYETVLEDVTKRDFNDTNRAIAPLKPAENAIIVDTTDYSLEKSIDVLKNTIMDKLGDDIKQC